MANEKKNEPSISVVSYNQSGGQTAYLIVNQGPPARSIDVSQIPLHVVARIRARTVDPIKFSHHLGDAEAESFKSKLMDTCRKLGLPVVTENIASLPGPSQSIIIDSKAPDTDLNDPLRVFAEWLATQGHRVLYNGGNIGVQENCIHAGLNP